MSRTQDMVGGKHNLVHVNFDTFHPMEGKIFVHSMHFGEKLTNSGIIMLNDDGREEGIKARWCKVWRVGKGVTSVKPGQWLYMKHGRWSRHINVTVDGEEQQVRMIDPNDILLVSDSPVDEDAISMSDFDHS